MRQYTLSKAEHLCSNLQISKLFALGKTYSSFPIACRFLIEESETEKIEVLFSVPKKHIKTAIGRNTLKRRMRESFRQNSFNFRKNATENSLHISIAFIWQSDEIFQYNVVEEKIIVLLERLSKLKWEN